MSSGKAGYLADRAGDATDEGADRNGGEWAYVRHLLGLLAPSRGRLIGVCLLTLGIEVLILPQPLIFGQLIERAPTATGAELTTMLVIAGIAVAVVSLLDDLRDMPPLPRLTVHLLAGIAPLFGGFGLATLAVPGLSLELELLGSGVWTLLFVVWFINLFNFMDGMDGFAGGMTLIGFGGFAVLGMIEGRPDFAMAAGVVAMATAGFLVFNFPPARVFLGDVGSAALGFLVAAFGLWADAAGIAPVWVAVMLFSPFFLDATVTAARRLLNRERVWEAHKTHYYQRMVQSGWSHRRTVLAEYALMIGCTVTAVAIVNASVWLQWTGIVTWLLIYLGCARMVDARLPRAAALS